MTIASWVIWTAWIVFGVGWELYTVANEKRRGTLPLTRIVRDRLARRFVIVRLGLLLLLAWLFVHFINNLPW